MIKSWEQVSISNHGIDVRDHEEEEEDKEGVELVIELCSRLRGGVVDVGSWHGLSLAVPQQALVGKCSGHQEQATPKSALEWLAKCGGSVTDFSVKQQRGVVHFEGHSANPEIDEFNVRKGVDKSHAHPPGSATAGSGNLWDQGLNPIALIGPSASRLSGGGHDFCQPPSVPHKLP
jgi:hypothetical protein